MIMAPEIISSAQNPTIKSIRALEQKKHRQETGLFVAEGLRAVERAHAAGIRPDMIVSVSGPQDWGQARDIRVPEAVMARLSAQNNPSGLIGVFKQSALLSAFNNDADIVLALEDIRDPGNLGTIIRTADALAIRHIVLVGESCDPFSPETVRASMGSLFGVTLTRLATAKFHAALDEWRGEIVATAADAQADFRRLYQRPTLLLMGSEGSGLTPGLAAKANVAVRIPMPGQAESLNVATASALLLYEIRRPELK